jgi:hypothetical protein
MRALPDDNLAYPVLLQLGDGSLGSGFYLGVDSGIYLVTARHVLYEDDGRTLRGPNLSAVSYPRDPSEKASNRCTIELLTLETTGNIRPHSERDVAVIRFGVVISPNQVRFSPGVRELERTKSGIVIVNRSAVKLYDQVLVGNDFFLFGYPSSLGLKQIPQLDAARPLLRKGIIAGKNDALRNLILDCAVYPGNSGGPIVEVEQAGLTIHLATVGVVSQFVPVVENWINTMHRYSNIEIGNSGYSVATPIDYVLEVIASF